MNNKLVLDPIELYCGTSNRTHPVYTEALDMVKSQSPKMQHYVKNFLVAIKRTYKHQNKSIVGSKGNITACKDDQYISKAFQILDKHVSGDAGLNRLKKLYEGMKGNASLYGDGYTKQIDFITLEYETAAATLIHGLEYKLATHLDIDNRTAKLFVTPRKDVQVNDALESMIEGFAREISSEAHRQYLRALIDAKEEFTIQKEDVFITESSLGDAVKLITSIVTGVGKIATVVGSIGKIVLRSLFGILPLIRAAVYMFYQRKADKIIGLEEQIKFIEFNIGQLEHNKSMPQEKKNEVIAKQKAVIEAYKKKCAKLRAELTDQSETAKTELKRDTPALSKSEPQDDFVLD